MWRKYFTDKNWQCQLFVSHGKRIPIFWVEVCCFFDPSTTTDSSKCFSLFTLRYLILFSLFRSHLKIHEKKKPKVDPWNTWKAKNAFWQHIKSHWLVFMHHLVIPGYALTAFKQHHYPRLHVNDSWKWGQNGSIFQLNSSTYNRKQVKN